MLLLRFGEDYASRVWVLRPAKASWGLLNAELLVIQVLVGLAQVVQTALLREEGLEWDQGLRALLCVGPLPHQLILKILPLIVQLLKVKEVLGRAAGRATCNLLLSERASYPCVKLRRCQVIVKHQITATALLLIRVILIILVHLHVISLIIIALSDHKGLLLGQT